MKPRVLWHLTLLLSLLSARVAYSQIPAVSFSPKRLNFGSQSVGIIGGAQIVTFKNAAGGGPLTISAITAGGDFAVSADATTTCSIGAKVPAGGECGITVTFTPTANGSRKGTLTITDNNKGKDGSTQVVALNGTGIPPERVKGSSRAPSFAVNQDYCDTLSSSYDYNGSGVTRPSKSPSPTPPTGFISSLRSFSDNGDAILTSPSWQSGPMKNGNDANRLLVRAFDLGPCIDAQRESNPSEASLNPNSKSLPAGAAPLVIGVVDPHPLANAHVTSWTWTPQTIGNLMPNGDTATYTPPTSVTLPTQVTITATYTDSTVIPPVVGSLSSHLMIQPNNFSLTGEDAAEYYVINIVKWRQNGNLFATASSDWYLYNVSDQSVTKETLFGGAFHPTISAASRIYGSKSIGFLAVHLKPDDIDPPTFRNLHITYNVKVTAKQAFNVQDLMSLVQILEGTATKVPGATPTPAKAVPKVIGLYGGGLLGGISSLPDDITFSANVTFPAVSPPSVNKTPSPTPAPPAPAPTATATATATSTTPSSPPPCDGSTNSKDTTQQAACSFSSPTYDDEGLYHWDVSVGVPFKGLSALSYSSTDGTVTSKSNETLNAYGFFDIYPFAVDIKSPPPLAYPHLMLGLPFSGKVFNKPFLGIGLLSLKQIPGLGKIIPVQMNPYAGWVIEKEFKPMTLKAGIPATVGAVSNDLASYRSWKFQYGIEFSIGAIKSALTNTKVGTTAAPSTTTTKTKASSASSSP